MSKIQNRIKEIEKQLLSNEIIRIPRGKKYNQELKNRIAQHNSNIIHDSKYTLISDYINSSTKMTISCKIHGNFFQLLNNHLSGQGCPICGVESNAKTLPQEAKDNFIPRANIVHNNLYGYMNFVYINAHVKGYISCKIHGDFLQTPSNHLNGTGCPECAIENNRKRMQEAKDNFIPRANIIHDNFYSYPRTEYINATTKVIITCPIHGDFLQTPNNHLNGRGCPKCIFSRDQPTQLYLMQSECSMMIKIGISINPEERLKQLLLKQPFESKLIKTFEFKDFPTALSIEQEIHKKLKDYKVGFNGFDGATEWFYVSIDEALLEIRKAS